MEDHGKTLDKNRRKFYKVIDDEYFKQSDVMFPKEFMLKYKQDFNISHFIPVDARKIIQQIGLENGLFS